MPDFDTSVPHSARVYDYWLGGKDIFAADREAAEHALEAYPDIVFAVRANRAFLARAVRYLIAEAGIRQFLDVGTGIPTASNTHQVAQQAARARPGQARRQGRGPARWGGRTNDLGTDSGRLATRILIAVARESR